MVDVAKLTPSRRYAYFQRVFVVRMRGVAARGSSEDGNRERRRRANKLRASKPEEQPRYWSLDSLGDLSGNIAIHGCFYEALVFLQNLKAPAEEWPAWLWAMDDPWAPVLVRGAQEERDVLFMPSEDSERGGWTVGNDDL